MFLSLERNQVTWQGKMKLGKLSLSIKLVFLSWADYFPWIVDSYEICVNILASQLHRWSRGEVLKYISVSYVFNLIYHSDNVPVVLSISCSCNSLLITFHTNWLNCQIDFIVRLLSTTITFSTHARAESIDLSFAGDLEIQFYCAIKLAA